MGAPPQRVRSMLIKLRSKGDAKLRMEDRFHLEVVRVWDAGGGGTDAAMAVYRFYSRQASTGRMASSVASGAGDGPLPTATRCSGQSIRGGEGYRRLPNAVTLHNAERVGWVGEFDTVVVCVYSLVARRGSGGGGGGGWRGR